MKSENLLTFFFGKLAKNIFCNFPIYSFSIQKKRIFSKAITWIHCFEPFQHRISFLFEFSYFHSFDQTLEKIEKEIKIYWAFLALITLLCFCNSTASRYFQCLRLKTRCFSFKLQKRLYKNIWAIHVSSFNFFFDTILVFIDNFL